MKTHRDKITVIITSYNRNKLLRRAVLSVVQQSYRNLEIIIVDDASTDPETHEVLEQVASMDKRVRIVRNLENRGSNTCRNAGLALATGRFYTGLDDDDYFVPNRIEVLHKNYQEDYGFVSDTYFIDFGNGRRKKKFHRQALLFPEDLFKSNRAGNQVFTTVDKMRSIGGFDERMKRLQDQDAWLRLLLVYKRGKRINQRTYVMDVSHKSSRISTTVSSLDAYKQFYEKHRRLMSAESIAYNEMRLKHIAKEKVSLDYIKKSPIQFLRNFLGSAKRQVLNAVSK